MTKGLFTAIAGRYDRMNRILSLGLDVRWRTTAANLVRGNPTRILDLACGTGDFAFALARRFPDATITGVDITPAMLDLARAKNTSPRITFLEGDAQRLTASHPLIPPPYSLLPPPSSLISCAFGFRNFPDKSAALREARQALADGGELLVLEFFRPRRNWLGRLTQIWVKLLARLFCNDKKTAYNYLTESMRSTVTEEEFVSLAAAQGFVLAERKFFFPCCTCLRFEAIVQPCRVGALADANMRDLPIHYPSARAPTGRS